jgi:hypothetical protein
MTCKDCKFFIQGEGRSGTCQKHPYKKLRNGRLVKAPDGTLFVFRTYWSNPACKKHFERRESDGT